MGMMVMKSVRNRGGGSHVRKATKSVRDQLTMILSMMRMDGLLTREEVEKIDLLSINQNTGHSFSSQKVGSAYQRCKTSNMPEVRSRHSDTQLA